MITREELKLSISVALLNHRGRSRSEIAEDLGVTEKDVKRLLESANGLVELRYTIPADDDVEAQLIARYGLADAVVVEAGGADQEMSIIGQAAAGVFISRVGDGDQVALSCGGTLLEMISNLPKRPHIRLNISQLSLEGDPEAIHQSPATLVGLLRAKSSNDSYCYGLQLLPESLTKDLNLRTTLARSEVLAELRRRALTSKFVFVGIGPASLKSKRRTYQSLVSSILPLDEFRRYELKLGLVGEINNQLFDEEGVDRTAEIPELARHFLNVVSLDDLRQMASRPAQHQVVGVACGVSKTRAIHVALRTKLVNVLVTSRDTANRLLLE